MASSQNNKIGGNPRRAQHGPLGAGKAVPGKTLDEFDLTDELKGNNALSGDDQRNAPSERQEQAGATGDTDALRESFNKTDKHYRAHADELKRTERRH